MIETPSTHGTRLGPAAPPEPSWEELVSAALLGTERRTPPVAARQGRSSAAALLDAAAVSTVRRRAALRPAPARERPVPAPADPRPPLPPAARRRLALLLADRNGIGGGHRRGTAPDLTELLPQWLAAAARHGYRAPEALLPALLDAARARTDLRAAALAFAGPRALWLARLNDEWKFALRGVGSTAALPGADEPEAVRTLWEEGLFAERVSLLAALRRRDPAAGLALLAATWSSERAEDRLMFLDSLREGLSMADEPFLEQALSDRSRNVRGTAAELLSALPGTALAARMADRARACVSLVRTQHGTDLSGANLSGANPSGTDPSGTDPSGANPSGANPSGTAAHQADPLTGPSGTDAMGTDAAWALVVQAPRACDAAMQRDGVVPRPPTGRGERAWWLSQLLEAAPLECWSGWLGGRGPAEVVALPVADGWRTELHDAWCRAAVRQRDVAWTRALLGTPATAAQGSGTYVVGPAATASMAAASTATTTAASGGASPDGPAGSSRDLARLLTVLPEDERAQWVAEYIAAHGLSDAFRMLGVCAVPWTEPLGRAVVDALDIARDAGSYPWSFSGVMGLAERCLDPDAADRLAMLTTVPDEPADGSPGAVGYWSEAFQRLVGTLRLRATMRAELAP